MIKHLSLSLIILCYIPDAYSWADMGHQTVGEIAERHLTPETKKAINNILGPEKLGMAAIWADSIRDDPAFNSFKAFHFLDAKASKDILTILNLYPALLINPNEERSVKMIALRYLVHVIGDIHQPLHTGTKNNRGANQCQVDWDNEILNLHSVWDEKIIEYDTLKLKSAHSPLKFYSFVTYTDDLLKLLPLTESEKINIQSKNVEEWIKESHAVEADVYPNQDTDAYCKLVPTNIPKITESYKEKAVEIARKRLLYGGLRLAFFLNQVFKNGSTPGLNNDLSKEQILKRLDLTNIPKETE